MTLDSYMRGGYADLHDTPRLTVSRRPNGQTQSRTTSSLAATCRKACSRLRSFMQPGKAHQGTWSQAPTLWPCLPRTRTSFSGWPTGSLRRAWSTRSSGRPQGPSPAKQRPLAYVLGPRTPSGGAYRACPSFDSKQRRVAQLVERRPARVRPRRPEVRCLPLRHAAVAQWWSAQRKHLGGRRFEPCSPRHKPHSRADHKNNLEQRG